MTGAGMDVTPLSWLASAGAPPTLATAEQVRREFDTMLLRLMLEAGALPGGGAEGGDWSVLGGTVTQMLAAELAGQIDLGLGRLLLADGE